MRGRDRGQAHTLEGFVAASLLLASVLFALQATAVTPLTASTSSQHIENQLEATAQGLLATAQERGTLKPTILFVNSTSGYFHDVNEREKMYLAGGPPTPFGARLNETFRANGVAFNLNILYVKNNGAYSQHSVVHFGSPSAHAATARTTVTLDDDDTFYRPRDHAEYQPTEHNPESTGETLSEADAAPNKPGYVLTDEHEGPIYRVVVVEVVAWRM